MKKFRSILVLVSCVMASLTIVGLAVVHVARAQVSAAGGPVAPPSVQSTEDEVANSAPQSPTEPLEGYKAGLWREGKAVFSDWMLLDFLVHDRDRRGYRPQQPINFSHQIHVEKNQMECLYCHSGANRSSYATIPSTDLCMGCHKVVTADAIKQKYNRESPDLVELARYAAEKRPIPWNPVHNLPEHAHFTHKRHIKAGIGCQNCHGQIQKMPVVERVSSLKMGFCVSCHRENGASIDCSTCHY